MVRKKNVANIENVTRNAVALPALNVRLRKNDRSSIGSLCRHCSSPKAVSPTAAIANSVRMRVDVQP